MEELLQFPFDPVSSSSELRAGYEERTAEVQSLQERPVAKSSVTKTPATKPLSSKTPVAKNPVTKSSTVKASAIKSPTTKPLATRSRWVPRSYTPVEREQPRQIHLKFDRLHPFETVQDQFQKWGIRFDNAIALIPSNPVYANDRGTTVLMGAPQNGTLEIQFDRPVHAVTAWITSSQRVVMTAFDETQGAIARVETAGANLAVEGAILSPNAPLSLIAANIHRIQLHAFNGHLILSEFRFCP